MFEFVIGVVCTAIACIVYHHLMLHIHADGTLRIDTSNPEKDIYRLEINDLEHISEKKRIVLKIDKHANLIVEDSQK